ncbi:hypothetical protein Pfo_013277 [Paulownia fortunei]|nr:hypothetical protein Pfo_013277 [Paulownia fortunei]
MERENTQNRKRTRDRGGDEKKESHKGKKPESVSSINDSFCSDQKRYEFCDGIGVFDFPWLKEGVIFKADEYLEPEEKFAPCSYLDEAPGTFAANLDQSCVQNLSVSPALDGIFHDNKLDDDSFWSLKVDDLEPIDCIWSCLIDQPPDIGLNKG